MAKKEIMKSEINESVQFNDNALSILKSKGEYHIVKVRFNFESGTADSIESIYKCKDKSEAIEAFKIRVVELGLMS